MGVLQRFEDRLDRLVNGAFAKAFRAEVQPVEIASALQRELDEKAAIVTRDRTVAPNVFTVELGDHDFERLGTYAVPLSRELADMVGEHAGTQGYALSGPPEVELERHDDLDTGVFRVRSTSKAGVVAQPKSRPEPTAGVETPLQGQSLPPSRARLVVNDTAYPLTQAVTTLGRGTEADIRVDDPGVSRHHAAIHLDRHEGTYSVVDFASTNGTFVGEEKVAELALNDGDVIRIGATQLTFRSG